jgi:hypothetical protein
MTESFTHRDDREVLDVASVEVTAFVADVQ